MKRRSSAACHVVLPRPLVQDLSLVRGKLSSVGLEHRV